jgi:hypothetical protein
MFDFYFKRVGSSKALSGRRRATLQAITERLKTRRWYVILLADLVERGLDFSQPMTVVIDGAKALRKGVG